jgi:hypothetical protein
MKEFHSIEEVVFDSKLYCFAIEFFMVRSMREMWVAIGDMDRKFQWLKLMFDRRANYIPWCKCTFDIGNTYSYVYYCVLYLAASKFYCVLYVLVSIACISYLKCCLNVEHAYHVWFLFQWIVNILYGYVFFTVKRLQYQSLWRGALHEVLLRLCCCQMVDANGSSIAVFSRFLICNVCYVEQFLCIFSRRINGLCLRCL